LPYQNRIKSVLNQSLDEYKFARSKKQTDPLPQKKLKHLRRVTDSQRSQENIPEDSYTQVKSRSKTRSQSRQSKDENINHVNRPPKTISVTFDKRPVSSMTYLLKKRT